MYIYPPASIIILCNDFTDLSFCPIFTSLWMHHNLPIEVFSFPLPAFTRNYSLRCIEEKATNLRSPPPPHMTISLCREEISSRVYQTLWMRCLRITCPVQMCGSPF